ncbi:hypothetical protein AMTR_s00029p00240040 [Amborella trichopoda]|uniref:Protein kinase domain-containing protein n=1 Tax=Amborella trichopoda TaxID=13333 RepID=W1PPZ3_AMBTC|nr:hypothetical protein AMTR_s00029p00240040 [Amborella trichopoda]
MVVAIKVLHLRHCGDFKSFTAECKTLYRIRHRNLVKLVTCCITRGVQGNDFKALILEYMCNGSVNNWLHPPSHLVMANKDQNHQFNLNLLQRLCIAIDVAYVVEYRHHDCPTPIVHCDLKPSNILLDEHDCTCQ